MNGSSADKVTMMSFLDYLVCDMVKLPKGASANH